MVQKKEDDSKAGTETNPKSGGKPRAADKSKDAGNLTVGNIKDVSGEINIAAGDIIKNIKTIQERALTAAEEADRARKIEGKLLAEGVSELTGNLSSQAKRGSGSEKPYKGLLSYGLSDAENFHGRKKAKKELLDHILQSSLTVLHAESGAGKSSLLQAGIAAQMIADGHLALYIRPHNNDPVASIKRMFLAELSQAPDLAGASLRKFLREVCAILGPEVNLYLLIDQFEEFFNLLRKEDHQPFLKALADCLNDPSLRVRWVLALRAEAFSDLSELEAFGIAPFHNTYRLNRLSHSEAREAIIEPAARCGIQFEPALVDHILDTLTENNEVMPTHLQLVCSALVDDLPEGVSLLTLDYFNNQEGGTEGILRDYLKRQLERLPGDESILAPKVLRALITSDGKRAVKTHDQILQELKNNGLSPDQVNVILARLVERRILFSQLSQGETFELAHDYLIKEIRLDPEEQARKAAQELLDQETRTYIRYKTLLTTERLAVIEPHQASLVFSPDSEELFEKSKKAVQQEKRAQERRRNLSVAALVLVVVLTILGLVAVRQANNARAIARTGELASQSIALRDKNLFTSLLLGIKAYQNYATIQSRGLLLENAQVNPFARQYLGQHQDQVLSVAFSPDGKTLATGSGDKTILLWDAASGQPIGQLKDHTDSVISIDFSPDGSLLASGSGDKRVILWDVKKRQPVATLDGHTDRVYSVAFSPDGKTLASGSGDETILLWDIKSHQLLGQLIGHQKEVTTVAFSPDGKQLASGSLDGTIRLWDMNSRELITELPNNPPIVSIAFSPDGKLLASAGDDRDILLWDVLSQQPVARLSGHDDSITSLSFSPDGKELVSGSVDRNIIVWNVETHQPVGKPLIGHSDWVRSVSFSPNGRTIASGGKDRMVILWDLSGKSLLGQSIARHEQPVYSVAVSPDGKIIASGDQDGKIILSDVTSGESTALPVTENQGTTNGLAFSPDGKMLASGHQDGSIILWDINRRQAVDQLLSRNDQQVNSLAFSPDGAQLVSGSIDGSLAVWDVAKRQLIEQLTGHKGAVNSVAFSPDGKTIASSGSKDKTIILWDAKSRRQIGQPLTDHKGIVYSIAFSPDGKFLASGSEDSLVILWNVRDQTPIKSILGPQIGFIYSVAFSPDGNTLATGGYKNSVQLWDVKNIEIPVQLGEPFVNQEMTVSSLAFSPDSSFLVSGSKDGSVILWNMIPQHWIDTICKRVGRNFTQEEWKQYFPNEKYKPSCQ